MVLLNPAGLAALTLIPVLVVLYLLRTKRRQLVVSTLLPWREVLEQTRRRSLFHRLRNPLSLLLQLLILALVAFALAQPEFSATARSTATTVILLDTSIRMKARDTAGMRFDAARRGVEALVRRAHADNQIALVAFDHSPRVLAPFTADERTLLEGLGMATLNDCVPDLSRALRLARDLLASRDGTRRIVLASDLPLSGPFEDTDLPIERMHLGPQLANIAITSFSVRPLLTNPAECEALVHVSNFSREKWEGRLEVELDGMLVDVRELTLQPGEVQREIIRPIAIGEPRLNANGWLTARIDARDALNIDDAAFAVAPSPEKRRVLLVSRGNWFLQNLLEADPRSEYELLSPDGFRPETARRFDVVVIDGERPKGVDLRDLTASNYLVFGVSAFRPPEKPPRRGAAPEPQDVPDLGTVAITMQNGEHPVLRAIDLSDVTILDARTLVAPDQSSGWQFEPVAKAGDHDLVVAGRRIDRTGVESQRAIVAAFGVGESDLPLRVAFPLLFNNALQWLTREAVGFQSSRMPGEMILLEAGESIWSVPQREPGGVPEELPPQQIVRESFRPLEKGFYLRKVRGRKTWVAVSGANAASSDLASPEVAKPTSPGEGVTIAAPRAWYALITIWPPWIALACGALAALVLEWWLYHRRRTE